MVTLNHLQEQSHFINLWLTAIFYSFMYFQNWKLISSCSDMIHLEMQDLTSKKTLWLVKAYWYNVLLLKIFNADKMNLEIAL